MLLLLQSRFSVSDSVRPRKWQPTRLRCPWDSPGMNTGVGCHFLLQCMKMKTESEVTRSVVSDPQQPHGLQPSSSSVQGIFQARVLEWGAIAFSIETLIDTYNSFPCDPMKFKWISCSYS